MIIGCPKEIKCLEHRVALIPAGVKILVAHGHQVLVESGAGLGSGICDQEYVHVGAQIKTSCQEVWEQAQIITKVKEPLEAEFKYFRPGQIIYTFLHLAAEPQLTKNLLEKKVTGIAYETIENKNYLPVLKPMSEVAGRMAVQVGAWCLENHQGGKGILLGGVPGVRKAQVIILGGGVVGRNAAKIAVGMGAQVTIFDINPKTLEELDNLFGSQIQTRYSTQHDIQQIITGADLIIGAVLIPGDRAPKLITRDMIKTIPKGSVIVDVAVDQGGCIETVRRTMHDDPTYVIENIIHYGVANMPGAVATTSTYALAHVTLPYLVQLANSGLEQAVKNNSGLALGVNTYMGHVTQKAVAKIFELSYDSIQDLLNKKL